MRTSPFETITATIKATALLSPVVFASPKASATSPEMLMPLAMNVQFASQEKLAATPLVETKGDTQTITLREPATEWNKAMDRRFEELSILEAISKISVDELAELEGLTKDRRKLQHPRSAEEILFEFRQRLVTSNLLKALQEYVRFHEVSN